MVDELAEHQVDRYSRQLLIDGIDEAHQLTLLSSRALVVGAGGLGAAIIQYLAAAGVGTIGIVDGGTVSRSNLQRQVIHGHDDIGSPKVDSAARFVEAHDPDIAVETYHHDIEPANAPSIVEDYDVVVDGLDNFRGRFLLNDVARLAAVPFIHGAVFAFEGQIASFVPGGACYRCLLPEVPASSSIPDDEPMGIFPTLPGIIGCIEATETIKYLIDVGSLIDDRLLRFDGSDGTFVSTPLERDPGCPVCGPNGIESIDGIDYDDRCAIEPV